MVDPINTVHILVVSIKEDNSSPMCTQEIINVGLKGSIIKYI